MTKTFQRAAVLAAGGLLAVAATTPMYQAAAAPPLTDVIVAFADAPGAREAAMLRGLGGTVRGAYRLVPAMAASVPAGAIAALQHNPHVLRVEPDVAVEALDLGDADKEVASAWGVDRLDANLVWGTYAGANGSGVGIAVCDTGSGPHPDLPAAAARWNCLSGSVVAGGTDDNGHGTHVAGSALAVQNSSGVVGMAPAAALFSYKVLNSRGSGSFSGVIAALDHIVNHNTSGNGIPIQVVSLSLGSSADPGVTVRQAFDRAYAAGVLPVAAAGNSGNRKGTGDSVNFPARYASVLAVAATDKRDGRASFSSTGPDVELSAPGVSITSTYLNGGYASLSGTSMATPHVSGAATQLFGSGVIVDGNGVNGAADEVRARLIETAKDLGAAGRDSLYGYGLVNPERAISGGNTHF